MDAWNHRAVKAMRKSAFRLTPFEVTPEAYAG